MANEKIKHHLHTEFRASGFNALVNIADKITEDEDSGSHKRGFMRAIQKYNHHKNHASDLSADQVKLENYLGKNTQ